MAIHTNESGIQSDGGGIRIEIDTALCRRAIVRRWTVNCRANVSRGRAGLHDDGNKITVSLNVNSGIRDKIHAHARTDWDTT